MSLLEKLQQTNRYKYLPVSFFSKLRGCYNMFCSGFIVKPYLQIKYNPHVSGKENIPPHGNFILAANHVSLLDPPLIAAAVGRPVAFMAKRELFNTLVKAEFYHSVGCFLLDAPQQPDSSTLKTAFNVLRSKSDWVLGMFPEGTRSTTGTILPLKKGLGSLAVKTNTPILPAGISRAADGQLRIVFGKLITDLSDADALQEAVYQALIELTKP